MSNYPTPSIFEIAIASNFTVEPIRNVMSYFAEQLQLSHTISFAPFNQVLQCLISPESLFAKNHHGVNLVFLRLEDCWPGQDFSKENFDLLRIFLEDFEKALAVAEQNHYVPLIVTVAPHSTKSQEDPQSSALLQHYHQQLMQIIEKFTSVHFIPENNLLELYPLDDYEDLFAYEQGKIPYTRECFTALGAITSRKIAAILRKPYKVIVLDCDNTLWKGVCAEDGLENLDIDGGYRTLQSWMVTMQQQGFLLCLCSKNLEQDVWSVFEHFKDSMPLKKQHIVSWRINWQPKSENIRSLSEELNLGLDSFIFLDDNEVECGEVRASLPEVASFRVPSQADEIAMFLKHLWVFDQLEVSKADRERSLFYLQDKNRKQLAKEAYSFDEFISQLQLHLNFYAAQEEHLDRIAQMTKRTNQFNLTGKILSAQTLRHSHMQANPACLVVEAKDRYGEYGIIACAFYILDNERESLVLDNLLISCRALGKRIEFRIWEHLCELAAENGFDSIDIKFVKTERNEAAQIFLNALNAEKTVTDGYLIYTKTLKNSILA